MRLPAPVKAPRAAMFPSTDTCYLHHYSPKHLATHPDQRVATGTLGPDQARWPDARGAILRLLIKLRDNAESLLAFGYCADAGIAMQ